MLQDLEENGYNDERRKSDSELTTCFRTGKVLKVHLWGTADRIGMREFLYGPVPYGFYCSVYSTVTQNMLGDWSVFCPVSVVLELWNEVWNRGIDRNLQKRFSGQKLGGLIGLDARTCPLDVLHLKINTLVKLFRRISALFDEMGASGAPGFASFASRVENYWGKKLKIKVYRMGEEQNFLSTNVRGALQFIYHYDRVFRIPGGPSLPEDASVVLELLLLLYLKVPVPPAVLKLVLKRSRASTMLPFETASAHQEPPGQPIPLFVFILTSHNHNRHHQTAQSSSSSLHNLFSEHASCFPRAHPVFQAHNLFSWHTTRCSSAHPVLRARVMLFGHMCGFRSAHPVFRAHITLFVHIPALFLGLISCCAGTESAFRVDDLFF